MRFSRKAGLTLAILIFTGAPAAGAQTLAQALEQAWARNPLAAALAARDDEAAARVDLADRIVPGAPTASVAALGDRFHRNDGAQKWEMEIGVPIWLPGQQAARRDEARALREEVGARRALLRWTLSGELRTRWWSLAAARAARELALRRVNTARQLESDVVRRFESGELARFDANLARNERLSAEAEAAQAQALVRELEAGLRALTGVPAPAMLAGETVEERAGRLEDHPRWRAADAVARAADASLLAALRSDREAPQVALRAERDRGSSGEPFANAVGVQLSIPFSWEPQVRRQTAAARAERLQAGTELATIGIRLQAALESARAALEAAERQLGLARARQAVAADNLHLSERSFSLGETDLTSLLRVRATALEADLLEARQRIASDAARSQLNQALGVLP